MGLFHSNWLLVLLLGMQGAGDNSLAVGASLLADYVVAAPRGHAGSREDGLLARALCRPEGLVRVCRCVWDLAFANVHVRGKQLRS